MLGEHYKHFHALATSLRSQEQKKQTDAFNIHERVTATTIILGVRVF